MELMSEKELEKYMKKHSGELNWNYISEHQVLSESFMAKYSDLINIEEQRKSHHDARTRVEKLEEMNVYAAENDLNYTDGVLIAYREHDRWDRGSWRQTICYNELKYYSEKCDW